MTISKIQLLSLLFIAGLAIAASSCSSSGSNDKANADQSALVDGESAEPEGDADPGVNENAEMNEAGGYGVVIDADNVSTIPDLLADMGDAPAMDGKVRATVSACCQAKGCWMNLAYGEGEEMRVTFRDYGFFVPYDLPGQDVIIQGTAQLDTLSVDYLRHLAEDAGKSAAEIEAINEPSTEVVFVADGVLLL